MQHFALLSHDPPFRPTHPKSLLFGHRCKFHGGGVGGGDDGGSGGGDSSVGASTVEQPQPQLLESLHSLLSLAPPPGFAQRSQHFDGLNHVHSPGLPLHCKLVSSGQTLPCESSLPRLGSSATGVASDQRDSFGAGGWGEMPAAKTTGSHCGGQATPAATPEATPSTPEATPSNMLLRRSTLNVAPTRVKTVSSMLSLTTEENRRHTNGQYRQTVWYKDTRLVRPVQINRTYGPCPRE